MITENGSCYRAADFTALLREVLHQRIPPYTPKNNGKVERYNLILTEELLYLREYTNEEKRRAAVDVMECSLQLLPTAFSTRRTTARRLPPAPRHQRPCLIHLDEHRRLGYRDVDGALHPIDRHLGFPNLHGGVQASPPPGSQHAIRSLATRASLAAASSACVEVTRNRWKTYHYQAGTRGGEVRFAPDFQLLEPELLLEGHSRIYPG